MASLSNVKVIGMENGKVTEIEHYGNRYVKTDDNAQEGDIGLRVSSGLPGIATIGDYYDLKGLHLDFLGDAEYWYVDDSGDRVHGRKENFVVFRKVEQPTTEASDLEPSLDERVTALESDVAELKGGAGEGEYRKLTGREPKAGDYVKFDEAPNGRIKSDKYYEIITIDSWGDPQIENEVGNMYDTDDDDFEVYEKVDGVKAQAEPKVGDRVEILPNHPFILNANQMSGEIINTNSMVRGKYDVKIYNYGGDLSFNPDEIRVVRKDVAEPKDPRKAFENGEKVRLVSGGQVFPLIGYKTGEIYEVSDNQSEKHDGKKIQIKGGESTVAYAKPEQLEKVSTEELAEIESESHRKSFSDGDCARVIEDYAEHEVGDIVKITNANHNGYHDFGVENLRAGKGFIDADKVEKLSEAEAKWTKIGRKPKEFKKGDIVRVDWIFKRGEVDELVEIDRGPDGSGLGGNYYLTNGEGTLGDHIVELITPVENRFDRTEA